MAFPSTETLETTPRKFKNAKELLAWSKGGAEKRSFLLVNGALVEGDVTDSSAKRRM